MQTVVVENPPTLDEQGNEVRDALRSMHKRVYLSRPAEDSI
jgi:hypothetical protein